MAIYDTDGDGEPNLSNIIVTYNHLIQSSTANLDYLGNQILGNNRIPEGTVVRRGQVLGTTGDHPNYDHLHFEVYLARDYLEGYYAININPSLMFSKTLHDRLVNDNIQDVYWPEGEQSNTARYLAYNITDLVLDRWSGGGQLVGEGLYSLTVTPPPSSVHNFWRYQDPAEGVDWPPDMHPTLPLEVWVAQGGDLTDYLRNLSPYDSFVSYPYYNVFVPYPYPNCVVPDELPTHLVLDCERGDLYRS